MTIQERQITEALKLLEDLSAQQGEILQILRRACGLHPADVEPAPNKKSRKKKPPSAETT